MKIGISGAKGSFSEEAARAYARRKKLTNVTIEYLVLIENVLTALEKGKIDLGVFPIQNSIGGIVLEMIYAVSKHNFDIRDIFDIPIKQNLMVRRGVEPNAIKVVTSHDQALRQCKTYLAKKWPKAKVVVYEDTAKAAEDLANGTLPATTAVIASKTAAKLYGLQLLAEAIQDNKQNATTFVAVTSAKRANRKKN